MSLKNISVLCYNMKVQNIYTYTFNQNKNFIKNTVNNLYTLA